MSKNIRALRFYKGNLWPSAKSIIIPQQVSAKARNIGTFQHLSIFTMLGDALWRAPLSCPASETDLIVISAFLLRICKGIDILTNQPIV
jgi:hypothetical protein